MVESITLAGDLDDLGVVQEAVEDRGRGRDVSDELAPVFQGAVAGHHGAAGFVAVEDDLEQVFARPFPRWARTFRTKRDRREESPVAEDLGTWSRCQSSTRTTIRQSHSGVIGIRLFGERLFV